MYVSYLSVVFAYEKLHVQFHLLLTGQPHVNPIKLIIFSLQSADHSSQRREYELLMAKIAGCEFPFVIAIYIEPWGLCHNLNTFLSSI